MQRLALLLFAFLSFVKSDLPIDCRVSDLWGTWLFNVGLQSNAENVTKGADYQNLGDITASHTFRFNPDAEVIDLGTNRSGLVTFIYNQGFEFTIDNQQWWVNFAFNRTTYVCSESSIGYVHDITGRNWGRIQGSRINQIQNSEKTRNSGQILGKRQSLKLGNYVRNRKYRRNNKFIDLVNQKNKGYWLAKHNTDNEKYTLGELISRSGNRIKERKVASGKESIEKLVSKAKHVHEGIIKEKGLPENLDWRNHNGLNYVSPVDDQESCGSCYAFASMGLLEAKARVQSNNTQQPIFSEQETITCGKDRSYSQGCDGGFSYIVAGKYAQDFGVVEESCSPYNYTDHTCPNTSKCKRWYAHNYEFVGGYYGPSEQDGGESMLIELQNGPIAVDYEVYDDFRSYSSGVYIHTTEMDELKDEFNPYIIVNHVVVCVGYGVCNNDPNCADAPNGTPYWIIKNSWGEEFGMQGYFYIIRGIDNAGIESAPFKTEMIPSL